MTLTLNLFIIAGALLAVISISATVNRVRKWQVHRIDRQRQPVRFWSSVAAGGLIALLGLATLTWGILQELHK